MSGMATANCDLQMEVTVCFIFLVTHVGSEDAATNTAATKKNASNKGKILPKAPLSTYHYYLYNWSNKNTEMKLWEFIHKPREVTGG